MIEEGIGTENLVPPTPELKWRQSPAPPGRGHRHSLSDPPGLVSSVVSNIALGEGSHAAVGRITEDAVLIGAAASWCTWTSPRLQSKYPEARYRGRTLYHAWRVSAAPNCSRRPEGGGK
jgi:hypothetical protein